MNKCKKNVLIIFGCLLVIALLIVPYNRVASYKSYRTGHAVQQYYEKSGLVFWPLLPISGRHFLLDMDLLTGELVFILLAAGFAYLICDLSQRNKKNRERFVRSQEELKQGNDKNEKM